MGFGEDLKDQLSAIDGFSQSGIAFLQDVKDYMKERAAVERDTAHKLEQLSKKYQTKRAKYADSLPDALLVAHSDSALQINASAGAKKSQDRLAAAEDTSSMYRAWSAILQEAERTAKVRVTLAEKVQTAISDSMKSLAQRKDEARKRHIAFASRLAEDRNRIYSEKDKAKQRYDESCDAVDAAKQKFERAPDEKSQDRFKKLRQQEIMTMHDAKNDYLVSIQVANSIKKKFYYSDMVTLQDQMQEMNEMRIDKLKKTWSMFFGLLAEADNAIAMHNTEALKVVDSVDPHADCETFAKAAKRDWIEPYDFAFEPCLLWKDTDQLATDDAAKIYLRNKLEKAKAELDELNRLEEIKKKEMDGLSNLFEAYSKNPTLGDEDGVKEQLLESQRHTMLQNNQRTRVETHIAYLTTVIELDTRGQTHQWQKASFTIPTTCDFCQTTMWGISKQGLTCKDCGYNCHLKCELKIPANCTQTKGGGRSQRGLTNSSQLQIQDPYAQQGSRPTISQPSPNVGGRASISSTADLGSASVLYDYSPQQEEELAISEGETIKILSKDDGSGWIMAQSKKGKGLIPAAYVQMRSTGAAGGSGGKLDAASADMVTAVYAYDAAGADELTIKPGDKIEIVSRGTEGWWEGKLNGRTGQFPASYVE